MMLPIILSSIAATAIVAERLWTLRKSRVAPPELLGQVWKQIKGKQLSAQKLKDLRANSPLGEILAAGLANSKHGREIMKECIEEAASGVIHELERYLNALGTIAAMAPLLGLLGTVFGMIQIFGAFMDNGMANSPMLAAGISKALITTAAGLLVAIPAVFFHRYLLRRVDELVIAMEQEAIKLVEVVQGDREDVFINLASLIDVIFVLLLFFVVSTTFTRPEQLNIELPSAESGETAGTEQKQLELSVDAEGHYALNGQALAKSDLATLMAAMQRESAGDNNLPVVISADAKSTHQSVVTAMDAAGKLGFVHLRITTVENTAAKP